ncbi:MAG: CCA tRNA nucleotidyltransferase, partial [Deltaproteobacteria bacterium]|nr:CCA tRNA nucleotidyltransferase [Deltaproteobacteria bacterium]
LGGLEDLQEGIVRIIGDPYRRFAEDPVRTLRAVEFACRLDFSIEEQTLAALRFAAPGLATVPPSRMREELRGLYTKGTTSKVVAAARETGLLEHWLPANVHRQADKVITLLAGIEQSFPLPGSPGHHRPAAPRHQRSLPPGPGQLPGQGPRDGGKRT